jgi:hypothetical protein
MEKWRIGLKNEKTRTYSIIGWLIVILNILCFLYYAFRGEGKFRISPLVAVGLLIIIMLYDRYSKRKTENGDRYTIANMIIVNAWIVLENYFLAALNTILYIFEAISRRNWVVLFYDDRLIYPSFPKRTIFWKDLNNVVLKDGLLTIDLKSNKVYQNETVTEINESQFNEFCSQRISPVNK